MSVEALPTERHAPREVLHDPSAPVLSVSGLRVAYNGRRVLDDIDFELKQGEQVAVIGPNGAGKSTLFKAIAGVLRPERGHVRIGGHDPSGHICIAYIPQRNQIDWTFPVTVRDVVLMGRVGRLGWFRYAGRQDRNLVDECMRKVGIQDLAHRQIGELSGGEQQRMFIARALAQEAELMLMDEVLTGCDVPAQHEIHRILKSLRDQRITIMVSTHDLDEAATRYDRVMLLNNRIISFGSARDAFTAPHLQEAYGGHLHTVQGEGGLLILNDTCCGGGEVDRE